MMGYDDNDIGLDLIMNPKKASSHEVMSSASSHDGRDYGSGQQNGYGHNKPVEVDRHSRVISSGSGSDSDSDSTNDGFTRRPEMNTSRMPGGGSNGRRMVDTESESDGGGDQGEPSFFNPPRNSYQERADVYERKMTEEEINNMKTELLYQFARLEKKGVRLPRKYTMASDLDDMKADLERIRKDRRVDASIKFQRRATIMFATGVETVNQRFDPIGAKLDGWSQQVQDDIDEYDDIFEELHEKYAGESTMSPELRLVMGLAGSAFMTHMVNYSTSAMPQAMADALRNNPDLARNMAAATAQTMQDQTGSQNGLMGMLGNFMNQGGGGASAPRPAPTQMPPQNTRTPQMRDPGNVDDILGEMNQGDRLETFSDVSDSDASGLGGGIMDI